MRILSETFDFPLDFLRFSAGNGLFQGRPSLEGDHLPGFWPFLNKIPQKMTTKTLLQPPSTPLKHPFLPFPSLTSPLFKEAFSPCHFCPLCGEHYLRIVAPTCAFPCFFHSAFEDYCSTLWLSLDCLRILAQTSGLPSTV